MPLVVNWVFSTSSWKEVVHCTVGGPLQLAGAVLKGQGQQESLIVLTVSANFKGCQYAVRSKL